MIQIKIFSGLDTLYEKTFEESIPEEEVKTLTESFLNREVLSQTVSFQESTLVSDISLDSFLNPKVNCITLVLKPNENDEG